MDGWREGLFGGEEAEARYERVRSKTFVVRGSTVEEPVSTIIIIYNSA